MGEGERVQFDAPDLIRLLWKHRKSIIATSIALGVLALVAAFLTPSTYEATTSLVPVSGSGQRPDVPGIGPGFAGLGALLSGQQSVLTLYPEIVLSRTVLEKALATTHRLPGESGEHTLLDLVEPDGHGPKRTEKAIRRLRGLVSTKADLQTGMVTIRVLSHWPTVSADLANLLSSSLQSYLNQSLRLQASRNREFIESRIGETQAELAAAEDALRHFRERNIRAAESPRLALEQARLERSVRELEEVYVTLRRQFELARIDERRDIPLLNTLDPAVPPTTKHSPRRLLAALLGSVGGGLVACLVVVLRAK